MKLSSKGFGAYDIRGVYPEEVNEELAYRIGRSFGKLFDAKKSAGRKAFSHGMVLPTTSHAGSAPPRTRATPAPLFDAML